MRLGDFVADAPLVQPTAVADAPTNHASDAPHRE